MKHIKVRDILQGWGRLFLSEFGLLSPEVKQEAERRLQICNTCPFRVENRCSRMTVGNNVITGKLTKGCGCNVKAKTLADASQCPAGKWNNHK